VAEVDAVEEDALDRVLGEYDTSEVIRLLLSALVVEEDDADCD